MILEYVIADCRVGLLTIWATVSRCPRSDVRNKMRREAKRYWLIDLLRGFTAFLIVGVHVVLDPRTANAWLLHDCCDAGVAIFAALSGFFMMGRDNCGWRGYVQNRARRLLLPYVIFSIGFVFLSMLTQAMSGGLKPKYATVKFWLEVVFEGNASTHMWFLVWLFYIQVSLKPILPRVHFLLLLILGVLGLVVESHFSGWYYVDYPLRLLGFLLIGCGLSEPLKKFAGRWPLFVAGVVLGGAWLLFVLLNGVVTVVWRDLMIVVCALCSAVLCSPCEIGPKMAGVCEWLGMTSMGVYLIHPLFSVGISKVIGRFFNAPLPYGLIPIVFVWISAYAVSLILVGLFYRLIKNEKRCVR